MSALVIGTGSLIWTLLLVVGIVSFIVGVLFGFIAWGYGDPPVLNEVASSEFYLHPEDPIILSIKY